MNKYQTRNLEALKEKLTCWKKFLKENAKDEIDLTIEQEIKDKLVMPIIKDIFFFIYNEEYILEKEYKIGNKFVDYAILNKKNEIAYLVEVKKYEYSFGSKMPLCKENHIEQICSYFSLFDNKPYFIVLTNGFDFLFYSNFSNANYLDREPFFKFSLLDDTIDSLKLFRLLNIKFYSRAGHLKVSLRTFFYMDTNNIKLNLKHVREEKGLTQKDLSEKLNVTQQRITNMEKNKCGPTLKLLFQLSEALNCTIYDLIDCSENRKEFNYYLFLINELKKNAPSSYIQHYLEDIELELCEQGLIPIK